MKKEIIYIGNDLGSKTRYVTSMQILSALLESEGYEIKRFSDKSNIFFRMLHMLYGIWKNRNTTDYILIDTFSTLNFYYAWLSSILAKILKIPYIPILRGGNLPNRLNKSPVLSRMIFKNAYVNVAPSLYLKEVFERHGLHAVYIPNVLDISEYPFKKRTKIKPKLLYVRSFAKHYNPLLAVKVLKKLLSEYPEAELCMVGPDKDGTLREVKDYVSKTGIKEKVVFTGVLTKKEWHKLSEKYDIFINTTNVDNTPVSVMEAMALGLPVVSTNVGGLPYLISHNHDGLLTEPDNAEKMKNAVKFLINNPDKSLELTLQARKKVEQFDWKVVKEKWNEVLT